MKNKIALVNKDLHCRLFEEKISEEVEKPVILRTHNLPPELILKDMIRRGLSSTTTSNFARPKTAQTIFRNVGDNRVISNKLLHSKERED